MGPYLAKMHQKTVNALVKKKFNTRNNKYNMQRKIWFRTTCSANCTTWRHSNNLPCWFHYIVHQWLQLVFTNCILQKGVRLNTINTRITTWFFKPIKKPENLCLIVQNSLFTTLSNVKRLFELVVCGLGIFFLGQKQTC